MDKPTKLIVDCATGESITVELTDEEIAQSEIDAANALAAQEAREAEEAAKAAAKASAEAKLSALGLTADEVKAIIG